MRERWRERKRKRETERGIERERERVRERVRVSTKIKKTIQSFLHLFPNGNMPKSVTYSSNLVVAVASIKYEIAETKNPTRSEFRTPVVLTRGKLTTSKEIEERE